MTGERAMSSEPLVRGFAAIRGLVYAVGFVLLWWWLATAVRPLDRQLPFRLSAALQPLGLAIAILGAVLALSCVVVFATRGRGTPAPFDAPRAFVPSGPYRFVRNPMYVGGAAVIAGTGLLVRSAAVVALAAGFLFFFHVFVLLYEEPTLRARFGESYEEYTRAVSRWLPRPTGRVLLYVALMLAATYLVVSLAMSGSSTVLDDTF
jgi:protein-S-isoprenylcysteine O-methyltransferase Ste14